MQYFWLRITVSRVTFLKVSAISRSLKKFRKLKTFSSMKIKSKLFEWWDFSGRDFPQCSCFQLKKYAFIFNICPYSNSLFRNPLRRRRTGWAPRHTRPGAHLNEDFLVLHMGALTELVAGFVETYFFFHFGNYDYSLDFWNPSLDFSPILFPWIF